MDRAREVLQLTATTYWHEIRKDETVRPNRMSRDTYIVTGIINSVGRLRMVLLDIIFQ